MQTYNTKKKKKKKKKNQELVFGLKMFTSHVTKISSMYIHLS